MDMFCPFIQTECRDDCIFNCSDYEEHEKEKCRLYDGIEVLRSFQAPNNQVDNRQQEIISELERISSNTGYDQTDSSSINSTLDDIKSLLREYLKNQN